MFSQIGFSLAAGACLHVRGDNGSGKTSLMRLLVGLSPLETGEIRWRGQLMGESALHEEMTYLGHHAAVNGDLTALENLYFAAAQDGIQLEPGVALKALGKMGLRGREDLPVRVLSAGQKRRVLLARLLVRPSKLWVLDEAFNALDVSAVGVLNAMITAHLQSGGVAVLTSHQPLALDNVQVLAL